YANSGGSAWLYSGRSGTLLSGFVPSSATAGVGWMMGTSVHSAGDTNGDGAVDWLIGVPGFAGSPARDRGAVFLLSGSDGGLLYHFEEPAGTWHGLGDMIGRPNDFDRDGMPDFLFGSPLASLVTSGGDVSIRTGHGLWVDSMPRIAVANQAVTLSIGQVV